MFIDTFIALVELVVKMISVLSEKLFEEIR